jgi:hypothetical protein
LTPLPLVFCPIAHCISNPVTMVFWLPYPW